MTKVVCYVELDADGVVDASARALTFARGITTRPTTLAALLPSPPTAEALGQLQSFGVSDVAVLEHDGISGYSPTALSRCLDAMSGEEDTLAVVAAATDHGNEVLAHLAATTGRDFVAVCTAAREEDGGGFSLTRHRWGGSLLEDSVLRAPRAIFSVSTDAVPPVPAPAATAPTTRTIRPELSAQELALQAAESRPESSGVALASAKVVVSGGRGVGGPEGFAVIEELAALLGGAVGVSRVVTSLGWRPHREQVGQTGTKVTPDLYLACGISGAIQHLAGCQSAKQMVAINTDPDAPIMARADYAVIGDVSEVLPALVAALGERRSRGRGE